jgi:hypothetical protein
VNARDRAKLPFGPYAAPPGQPARSAACLYRDCDVVVTGWTDARTPWPRCLPVGTKGHPSLLVVRGAGPRRRGQHPLAGPPAALGV